MEWPHPQLRQNLENSSARVCLSSANASSSGSIPPNLVGHWPAPSARMTAAVVTDLSGWGRAQPTGFQWTRVPGLAIAFEPTFCGIHTEESAKLSIKLQRSISWFNADCARAPGGIVSDAWTI